VTIGPLLCRASQDRLEDAKIAKIRTHMWKIWLAKNHGWMKIFIQLWKNKKIKEK
jgi:hypothetical protein